MHPALLLCVMSATHRNINIYSLGGVYHHFKKSNHQVFFCFCMVLLSDEPHSSHTLIDNLRCLML